MSLSIKKGDTVAVNSGKDRGERGKVLKIFPKEGRLVVEGINVRKKRQRPKKQGQKGQVVEAASPIARSNVNLFCSHCGKGVRFGAKISGKNKLRVCKKCGREI